MQKSTDNNKTNIIIAIASVSTLLLSFSMQSGILSAIRHSFPDVSDSAVQLIHSICSLASMPPMFASIALSKIISRKKCIVLGIIVLALGGLLPVALHGQLWMMYLSSILIGIGMGLFNISTVTLISEHFPGPDKGRVLGIQAALQGIGAAFFSVIGGIIADRTDWWWAYLIYIAAIPVLIVFVMLMPEDRPEKKPLKPEKRKHPFFLTRSLLTIIGFNILFNLMSTGFQANISMFIDVEGMGSVGVSGILTAFFMLIGVPVGFLLGKFIKKCKRWSNVIVSGTAAIGMALIFTSVSLPVVFIGTFLVGSSFAAYPPVNMTFICSIAQQENVSKSLALNNACSGIARFASPVVINFIVRLFHGEIRTAFVVCCAGLTAVCILLAFFNPVRNTDLE